MLQSEGDKVKYLLEWQYQETAETSCDVTEDVHSVAEGRIYLQARLPPDSTKGSFG